MVGDENTKNYKVNDTKPLIPGSEEINKAWELEDDDGDSLENLMGIVNDRIMQRIALPDVYHSQIIASGGEQTADTYNTVYSNYLATQSQNHSYSRIIGVRHPLAVIMDAIFTITRDIERYPFKGARIVSVVEATMIHYGLHHLDYILTNRSKVVQERLEVIRTGDKEKRRRGNPPSYIFVEFTERNDRQRNFNCQVLEDLARIHTITADYGWTAAFLVQVVMIIAIAGSIKLPGHMVDSARNEVRFFTEYLNKYY